MNETQTSGKKKGKKKGKGKGRASGNGGTTATTVGVANGAGAHNTAKPNSGHKKRTYNKWADKCMYAELLEMNESFDGADVNIDRDGIPEDIETGWVAVTPIPVGKRCLAITHQASGIAGVGTLPNFGGYIALKASYSLVFMKQYLILFSAHECSGNLS